MNPTILWDGLKTNTPLFRYLPLTALLSLLKGQIFVPSLKQLQDSSDPTEGSLPSTCPRFENAWGRFANSTEEELHQVITPVEYECIRSLHDQARHGRETPLPVPTHEIISTVSNTRGVLCFQRNGSENMAMWRIDAQDGARIETDAAGLESIKPPSGSERFLGSIRYVETGEDLEKEDIRLIARPYLFKQRCYEFEQESRWIIAYPSGWEGHFLSVDPKDLIKTVRLSPFIRMADAKILMELIRDYLPAATIEHSGSRFLNPLNQIRMPVPLGKALEIMKHPWSSQGGAFATGSLRNVAQNTSTPNQAQ